MIINLETQQIHFDLEHEIPYFQSPEKNRIRLDIDVLNKSKFLILLMLYLITNQRRNVHFCLNTYILLNLEKNKNWSFFNITNWYEEIHSADEKYVIATIKNIKTKT